MAAFTITCACGREIHTEDAHLGRQLRCSCGRLVVIERPATNKQGGQTAKDDTATNTNKLFSERNIKRRPRSRPAPATARNPELVIPRRSWLSAFPAFQTFQTFRTFPALAALSTFGRVILWAAWAWLAVMILAWWGLYTISETSLPFAMLLCGPRWVLLLPLALLLPASLFVARRALLPITLSLWVGLFPVMGFRISRNLLSSTLREPPAVAGENVLRILTLNAQGGGVAQQHIDELMVAYAPDILGFQECGRPLVDRLVSYRRASQPWFLETYNGTCTLSRWPIVARDSMPRTAFAAVASLGYGGAAMVIRYTIKTPHGELQFVNQHLETARKGLSGILGDEGLFNDETGMPSLPTSINGDRFAFNAEIRDRESERSGYWSSLHADRVPVVVVGDFNMPVESSIYRRYWRKPLVNAFEKRGLGFGFSKFEGSLLRIRIDHVLAAPRFFDVQGAWVLKDVGSDHRPVLADLKFKSR